MPPVERIVLAFILPVMLLAPIGNAAEVSPTTQPEEIVVVGRQPGPPLWRVKHGDNTLWIFPYLQVIPKDMIWESDRVERVIAESQEYIGMPRQEADTSPLLLLNPVNLFRGYRLLKRLQRSPDGSTLEESLTPDVYARFSALQASYFPRNDELDELRPVFAAGRMTVLIREEEGLVEHGEILDTIRKHARRNRDMKLTDIAVGVDLKGSFRELAGRAEAMLDSLTPEQEQACFEQRLRHMEEDLEHIKSRANTWAQGYVDEFRNIPLVGEEGSACLQMIMASSEQDLLVDTNARLDQMWLDAAQAALTSNTSTFAVLDINDLLRADGPMSKLRAMGYAITEP
jgi:hypothetical protein